MHFTKNEHKEADVVNTQSKPSISNIHYTKITFDYSCFNSIISNFVIVLTYIEERSF